MAMAERIRRWRESIPMSKATLAQLTGYDPSTITGWEKGCVPGHSAMIRIAGAFGVDLATFFGTLPVAPSKAS
jgi:transcriptional regulator with XRE-family HTH domain